MRVLLIRPPAISYKKEPFIILSEPLGLLYIASYLKKYYKGSIEIGIIDGFAGKDKFKEGFFCGKGLAYKELEMEIKEFSPDIVGITCTFTEYSKGAHDVARIIKGISKDIPVVCGGVHASALYDIVLKDRNIDLIVRGEGEETFLEIVQRYRDGRDFKDIRGTAIRIDNNTVKLNPPRPYIEDLDKIPYPLRELLDMDNYYNNDEYALKRAMRYPRLSIITSRGCPYRCIFCSIHSVWGNSYRARSPKDVVDEIELLCKDYGIREIVFYDDNMTLQKDRINEICDEIIRRKIDIKWSMPNGVAIWTLDKQTVLKMKRAGCYKITFGLESGSLDTLRFIGKDFIDFNKAKEIIKFANRIGLWTVSSFIIGFPYERKKDVYQTLSFALDCDVDMASFYCATPHPGSRFYELCTEKGFFPAGREPRDYFEWRGEIGEAMCDMKYLKKEEINFLVIDLKKKFIKKRFISFLNPLRIIRKLRNLEEIRYFLNMFRLYLKPYIKRIL